MFFFIVVLVIISTIIYDKKNLSEEEIFEIVKPKLEDYCSVLANNASHSYCATCSFNEYKKVNNFSKSLPLRTTEYSIETQGENKKIEFNLYVIYGSNTRMGKLDVAFILNSEGDIIQEEYPERTCV